MVLLLDTSQEMATEGWTAAAAAKLVLEGLMEAAAAVLSGSSMEGATCSARPSPPQHLSGLAPARSWL